MNAKPYAPYYEKQLSTKLNSCLQFIYVACFLKIIHLWIHIFCLFRSVFFTMEKQRILSSMPFFSVRLPFGPEGNELKIWGPLTAFGWIS